MIASLMSNLGWLVAGSADLAVDAVGTPNPVVVGGNLTFTYQVRNLGPDTATGLVLSNALPPSLIAGTFSCTNGVYTLSNNVLVYYPEDLPAGGCLVARFVCTPVNLQTVSNRVFVSASQPDPTEWNSYGFCPLITVADVGIGAKLKVARSGHTATLLPDGRVLLVGGAGGGYGYTTSTAETYDPRTEEFTLVASMSHGRMSHTATLLPDGTVLIAGGTDGAQPIAALEVYDPTSNNFKTVASLSYPRSGHTATLLGDGRVLLAGGTGTNKNVEIYSYSDGSLSTGGELLAVRAGHLASLLPDGKVLFVGGSTSSPRSAEAYNPETGVSTPVGSLLTDHILLSGVTLSNGKLLVCGGATAELYDPVTAQFAFTGPPVWNRHSGRLTLLKDGRVLLSGGGDSLGYLALTELYAPATGLFTLGSPMSRARIGHSSVLLQDGRVLIAGGAEGQVLDSSEIAALGVDKDLDGMDDDWELRHGFNPADRADAVEDADHDGHTNLQEYLAGTDPRDANSVMRITTCQMDATTFRIDFTSALGKLYRVERTLDLQGANWEIVADNLLGTGATMRVVDTPAPGRTGYLYRVRLVI